MKNFISAALLSGALILCGSAYGQSLEFSKDTVESYKPGNSSVKATMIMQDGSKHPCSVQLQNNIAIKDLTEGNLIFVKEHGEVFQVITDKMESDGRKSVDIKSTNLIIDAKKAEKNKKKEEHMNMSMAEHNKMTTSNEADKTGY